MQPFMKERESDRSTEAAIGLVEYYTAKICRVGDNKDCLVADLLYPGIEKTRLIAQMQATDHAQIGQLSQQRQRFGNVDALVIGRLSRHFDLSFASRDAINAHQY